MGKGYLALITATIYDCDENRTTTIRTMCYAMSFTEAMQQVEDYFGNELETVHVELLDCVPYMTEDMFNHIRKYSL